MTAFGNARPRGERPVVARNLTVMVTRVCAMPMRAHGDTHAKAERDAVIS